MNGRARAEPYVQPTSGRPDVADRRVDWQRAYLAANPSARARYQPTRDNRGPLVVPDGYYFLLGDNRDDSLDSRWWGVLSGGRIKGRVEVVYFSWGRAAEPRLGWVRAVRWHRIFARIR